MGISNLLPAIQLSVRTALGVGLAIASARLLGFQYPIYAMISAVLVTDLSPGQTRKLGVPRLWGTVLGASLGGVFSTWLQGGSISIGFGILVTMLLSHLMRLQDAAKVAGYVCGIILLNHGDHAWSYALHRFAETVLGVGVAVLLSFFPKLLSIDHIK